MTNKTKKLNPRITEEKWQEILTDDEKINCEPVMHFLEDLTGAKRMLNRGVKLINGYSSGSLYFDKWDTEDAISDIYEAVATYEPKSTDKPFTDFQQGYFGVESQEQSRKGYNAIQKMVYYNNTRATNPEYNQDYGQDGTHAKDDIAELELELLLSEILTQDLQEYLDHRLSGYSLKEIAELMGISESLAKKKGTQLREIFMGTFEVEIEKRKFSRIKRK